VDLDLLDQDYLPQHLRKEPSASQVILSRRSEYSTSKVSLSKPERKKVMKSVFKSDSKTHPN
jgi:hypothetical protein